MQRRQLYTDCMAGRRNVVLVTLTCAAWRGTSTALAASCTSAVNIDLALQPLIGVAVADLAQRLGVAATQVCVLEARAVVWPDRGLGCPLRGMRYPQVLEDGVYIRLSAGGGVYHYHGGGSRTPFLCEAPDRQAPPAAGGAGQGGVR